MEHSPESFSDNDLFFLIDSVDQATLDQMEAERIEQLARKKLWKTIKKHHIPITICRYPENKDELLDRFVDFIIEQGLFGGESFDSPEQRYNAAVEIAEGTWNNEENILERLVVCLENQLIAQPLGADSPSPDVSFIKKRFMAELIAENQAELYSTLADVALAGAPLHPSGDDYFDICTTALFDRETDDRAPHRTLYYDLRTILGIPFDGLLPNGPYTEAQMVTFLAQNDAIDEIVAIARLYLGACNEGVRHREISEIMAEFSINSPTMRQAIFDSTDAYREVRND